MAIQLFSNTSNNINNTKKHTWCRGSTLSTLDYIIGPLHLVHLNPDCKIVWGIDKSDHTALLIDIEFELDRGRGMFRPRTSFFNCPELKADFERACLIDFSTADNNWDPHMRLEFSKVAIRTHLSTFSNKYRVKLQDKQENIRSELERLQNLKTLILITTNTPKAKYVNALDIDTDIYSLEDELNTILELKTKSLASSSRIEWLEKGERSNKYFMNLNKSSSNKAYFKSLIVNNTEIFDTNSKINAVHELYSNLYSKQSLESSEHYLQNCHLPLIANEHSSLYSTIDPSELKNYL